MCVCVCVCVLCVVWCGVVWCGVCVCVCVWCVCVHVHACMMKRTHHYVFVSIPGSCKTGHHKQSIITITIICTNMHLDCTTQVGTHTHSYACTHRHMCKALPPFKTASRLTWTECWHWRGPRHCHQHRHTSKQTHLDGVPPRFKTDSPGRSTTTLQNRLTWTEYHHTSKQTHLDGVPPHFKTLTWLSTATLQNRLSWIEYHHTSKQTHLDGVPPHFKTDSPGWSTATLQNRLTWMEYCHTSKLPPHFKTLTWLITATLQNRLTWIEYCHTSKLTHLDGVRHTSKQTHLDGALPHFKTDSPGRSVGV